MNDVVIKGEWMEWAVRVGILYIIFTFLASFIMPIVTFIGETILRKLRDRRYKREEAIRKAYYEAHQKEHNERDLRRYFGEDYEVLMKTPDIIHYKHKKHGRRNPK